MFTCAALLRLSTRHGGGGSCSGGGGGGGGVDDGGGGDDVDVAAVGIYTTQLGGGHACRRPMRSSRVIRLLSYRGRLTVLIPGTDSDDTGLVRDCYARK